MATSKQQGSTLHPVWVGNLHDCVTETMLKQKFSGFGSIETCSIMRDSQGKTRNFGYVNFLTKSKAENAAKKLEGKELAGKPMKTKGPSVLRKEGHLKRQGVDYRPLTDCTFFMERGRCAKGDECPYRHSEVARVMNEVCIPWMDRTCTKKKCSKKHPRLTESHSDSHSDSHTSTKSGSYTMLSSTDSDSDEDGNYNLTYEDLDHLTISSSSSNSPSPGPRRSNSTHSPYIKRGNSATIGMLGSTQSFSISSDDEEEYGNQADNNMYFRPIDSSSDEDDEDDPLYPSAADGLSRLTSLTESHMKQSLDDDYDDDDNGGSSKSDRLKLSGSFDESAFKQVPNQHPNSAPSPLEPVGLFWDIENCSVPLDKSAFALANKMRQVFFRGKREVEFMCVCDITKERKEVTDDLHRAHVTLVHVNAIAKNAADDKLKHSLRRFAQTFHPPATVVLVSGDVNFSFELNDLQHVHHVTTVLVHNAHTADALKVCAHQTILFEDFIRDVASQQRISPPTSTILIAHGLPTMDPHKIRNRLSRLADNCGGKVLNVDPVSKTARILFRTYEYALKAQKRMTGEDVYGRKIKLEIEPQRPNPSPRHPFNQQPRPQIQNRHTPTNPFPQPPNNPGPMRPQIFYGPRSGPFPPPLRGPHPHGPHPHMHQQPTLMPHPPPHMMPHPPPHMMPHPPQMSSGNLRFFIKGLIVAEESEFDNLTAIFTELRMSVNIKTNPPDYYWESYSRASLLSDFMLRQTAELRLYQPVMFHIQRNAPIPTEVAETFVNICINDLNRRCQSNKNPWKVSLCQWNQEEEMGRRKLSNIVSLLKKYERHWARLDSFRHRYMNTYNDALSEMMIQQCGDVIQLLSSNKSDTVIMFTEFSPLLKIRKTDEFLRNSLKLIESQPDKKIKLIEFVEAYRSKFDKLGMRKNGSDLQEIFSSDSTFFVSGGKPSALMVSLKRISPVPAKTFPNHPTPTTPTIDLTTISGEFIQLVKDSPGQQIALNCFQQEYQTKFHKSFRVSDILPGTSGVKALIKACQGVKCVTLPYGLTNEIIVVLDQPSPQTPPTKTTPIKPPPTPGNRGNDVKLGNKATPKTTTPTPLQLELFKQDMTALLQTVPGGRLPVCRIPDLYMRHFKNNYQLATYGGAKTVTLLKSIPDTVMIDGEGDERVVQLISFDRVGTSVDEECHMTKNECERKIEDMIYHQPNHQTTLDRFLYDYDAHHKEKLTSYCGHAKLLLLLQDMKKTIEVNGTGARRIIRLVPLRLFACRMKDLLSSEGEMKLSCVVPEYKKKFKEDFNADLYGKTKLLQVVESIPDIVKITGDGPKRIVSLVDRPSLPLSPATPPPITPRSPPPSSIARLLFMDEVTSLLLSYPDKELTLQKLCEQYHASFKRQMNLRELKYESSYEAVKGLSNVQVIGEGFGAMVKLKPDTASPEPSLTTPTNIKVEPQRSSNGINTAVQPNNEQIEDKTNEPPKKPKPRLCRTICVRLLSEIHRILLCHSEHSMLIEELCSTFKDYDEQCEPTPEDLMASIDTYTDKDSSYKFNVSKVTTDVVFVSLTLSDAMWKLSRDLVYLFVYCPCEEYTMTVDSVVELYKTCYGRRLNPMVYKSDSVTELMKRKQLKQTIKFNEETKTISLLSSSRIQVFTQLACELLFRLEPECGHVNEFVRSYERYFKCPLSLMQLQVSSIQELVTQQGVNEYIDLIKERSYLTLSSRGLYCEQLRHLLTVHNGRIPEGLLLTMYLSEFRHPRTCNSEILRWVNKEPIRPASHIANLASDLYVVWAPVGRPYPKTRSLEQSTLLPDERSVTLNELGDVPELVSSIVMENDTDMPSSMNITLPELVVSDLVISDMPELLDDDDDNDGNQSGSTPLLINNTVIEPLSASTLTTPTNIQTTPSNTSDFSPLPPSNIDEITGLNHGEFAGLHHQTVVSKMQQELRGDSMDSRAKIQRMGDFLNYFGELSDLELKRVEPPVPKPRRNKSKTRLAIQFPGSSSDSLMVEDDSVQDSPHTSPVLGEEEHGKGTTPDCLSQSNAVDRTATDWGQ